MPSMTLILIGLSIEYLLIAGGFYLVGDKPRCLYFISAAVLNITIIFMR